MATGKSALGVPARNPSDVLGLEMLSQVLGPGWTFTQLTTATLASELLLELSRNSPEVLCISSFPPGGLSHARYLCKRIHNQFPSLPIWVLRPEAAASADKTAAQLSDDGAQQVATSFAAATTQLERFVFEAPESALADGSNKANHDPESLPA